MLIPSRVFIYLWKLKRSFSLMQFNQLVHILIHRLSYLFHRYILFDKTNIWEYNFYTRKVQQRIWMIWDMVNRIQDTIFLYRHVQLFYFVACFCSNFITYVVLEWIILCLVSYNWFYCSAKTNCKLEEKIHLSNCDK